MKLINKNIWDLHGEFDVVVTNNIGWDPRTYRNNMGAGTTLEASIRYPHLPCWYGAECASRVTSDDGVQDVPVLYREVEGLYFFPVKPLLSIHDPEMSWNQKADIKLIRKGLYELADLADNAQKPIAMTLPGAGNGGLPPDHVLSCVQAVLGNRDDIIVCDRQLSV